MSQITKLLLKIVMDRMKMKVEAELDDAQSGFRQGKGTREGLLNLRLICERHLEVQKDVYICFLDYEKAFDRVRHEPLMQCLLKGDWSRRKRHKDHQKPVLGSNSVSENNE